MMTVMSRKEREKLVEAAKSAMAREIEEIDRLAGELTDVPPEVLSCREKLEQSMADLEHSLDDWLEAVACFEELPPIAGVLAGWKTRN